MDYKTIAVIKYFKITYNIFATFGHFLSIFAHYCACVCFILMQMNAEKHYVLLQKF